MIKEITGYKWQNENGAHGAEAIAKNFYGYPLSEDSVTQTAFEALHNEGSEGDFWYFEGEMPPLGNVQTFNINVDNEV